MAPLIVDDFDFASAWYEQDVSDSQVIVDEQRKAAAPLQASIDEMEARPRCVWFGDHDAVEAAVLATAYQTLSLDEITPEEKKAAWYSPKEMKRMQKNSKKEALLMECGLLRESEDETNFSLRGIENRTKKGIPSQTEMYCPI